MPIARQRRLLLRAAACAGPALALRAHAQAPAFPSRPVTLIIPFPPGGPTDRHMRLLADLAAGHLGQPVLVENRSGAGGTLGPVQMALNARPDGYTIAQYPGAMVRLPHLQKVAWHPIDDFAFICGIAANGFGLVVRADSPLTSVQDFMAAARQAPGRVDYGSAGVGTSSHLLMEQLARAAGVQLTHVPYKGATEMLQAVLGGHLMSANDASGWEALVDEGRLRLLLTFGDAPAPRWPQVPTALSQGWPVVSNSAHGLVAPRHTPAATLRVLHDAFRRAMESPAHLQMLRSLNQQPMALDGAAFRRWAIATFEQERSIIEQLGPAVR